MDGLNGGSGLSRYAGWVRSCQGFCPGPVGTYCAAHLDTTSKAVNHALALLAVCDILLLFSAAGVSLVTTLAAALLAAQTGAVAAVMNHDRIGQRWAVRTLEPTEFMVGLCLGLSVGGAVLSFFLSITFRRAYAFCVYAEKHYEEADHQHACGTYLTRTLWGVWWWSSAAFWLDVAVAALVAVGRSELARSPQQEYRSIGGEEERQQQQRQYGASPFQQASFQHAAPAPSHDSHSYGDFATPGVPPGGAGARILPV